MIAINPILASLKQAGHRITKVRQAVIDILQNSKTPITVSDLITRLERRKLKVNKTTVYRELEFLLTQKVIREIDLLEGMKRYELIDEGGHHHHVVCLKCSNIQCVDMERDLDQLERYIQKNYGFKVTHHTLEFFGICSRCR